MLAANLKVHPMFSMPSSRPTHLTTLPMRPSTMAVVLGSVLLLAGLALPATPTHAAENKVDAVAQLAPSGTLRAAINYGNAVLAVKNPKTGALEGVSVDLAEELGKRLGVPVKLVPYAAARTAVEGASKKEWDVAFTAIDPKRAQDMAFTAPYLVIEGTYMVRQDSPIKTNADVDKPGVRVAISSGSAYDLFLSRSLKQARLVRTGSPTEVTDMMMAQSLDVVAGVKQRNQADAERVPGLRMLDGNFMEIRQAMATIKGRDIGARYLSAFVEEMKANGFVKASLARHHNDGVTVAAPANH